jgi:hypothetical protein
MLTSGDLTQMRSDLAQLLPDTCAILSPTMASDGMGGWTTTWGTAAASVACRIDPDTGQAGREVLSGGAVEPYHRYILTLAQSQAIATTNRVVVGGHTYSVISVDAGKSWAVSTRCSLERCDAS